MYIAFYGKGEFVSSANRRQVYNHLSSHCEEDNHIYEGPNDKVNFIHRLMQEDLSNADVKHHVENLIRALKKAYLKRA